ncbi:MAG: PDZ domain-containing protein [Planctomycetaceae bacterium]|jgi:membrane-associated protease RseP (regulator of RpoE activity)|nr:PDZ domain-containing protein [Planctomycetaceae bacterium]
MLKRKILKIVSLFCTVAIAGFLCSVLYVYGQNHEKKDVESKSTDCQNQTTTIDAQKNNTNDENKNTDATGENTTTIENVVDSDQAIIYRLGMNIVEVPELLLPHFSGIDGVRDNVDVNDNITGNKQHGMVVVADVMPNSPAAKAGVKRGDVIVKFGGKKIDSPNALVQQVNSVKDTEQELVFIRNNKKMEFKITPEKLTSDKWTRQETVPLSQDFRLLPHRHFRLGDRKQLLREMEEMVSHLQDNSGIDLFFSFPDGKNLLPNLNLPKLPFPNANSLKNLKEGEAKSLTITTQTDSNGKSKIKVNKSITTNGKTEENVWEAENIDQLPENIRDEVRQFIETNNKM